MNALKRLILGHRKLAIAVATVVVVGVGTAAWAYFTSSGTGSGGVHVASLSAPANVQVTQPDLNVGTVRVSWNAVTPPAGSASEVTYYVQRFSGSTPSNACGSTPTSGVAASPCDDPGVANGTYTYRVTALFRTFTAQSAASGPITLAVVSDHTPPVPVLTTAGTVYSSSGTLYTSPVSESTWPGAISGTASDDTGVTNVGVAVKQNSSSLWWDWSGSTFSLSSPSYSTASGLTSWSKSFPIANFPAGGDYTMQAKATDAAGNPGTVADVLSVDYKSANTIFVGGPGANDAQNGSTPALADATITAALTHVNATRNLIVVAAGTYNETVSITPSTVVSIRGGYSGTTWLRATPGASTVSIIGAGGTDGTGVLVNGATAHLQQLSINSGTTSTSAYGVRAMASASVTVEHTNVVAAKGANGAAGTTPSGTGTAGNAGGNGTAGSGSGSGVGGTVGNGSGTGGAGGIGGNGVTSGNGQGGGNGTASGGTGGTGGGGSAGSLGTNTGGGTRGTQGAVGTVGANGAGGTPGSTQYAATFSPASGANGSSGTGGGGGGGGGGTGACLFCSPNYGSGGGGGGQGGTGGAGGNGGVGGGGSFGVYASTSSVTFDSSSTLTSGDGGDGGNGGNGQAGGLGGKGGNGGAGAGGATGGPGGNPGDGTNGNNGSGSTGGGGGAGSGGAGGVGGGAGGGAGGPSFGSLAVGVGSSVTVPNPATQIVTGNPGAGGAGGGTAAAGSPGTSGNQGNGSDSTAPAISTMQMFDANANGKIDKVVVTFNEPLAPYSAGNAPWTLANVPSGGTLSSVVVSGAQATLNIAEGGGAVDTGVGSFTVALASSSNGIRDVIGNRTSFSATAPADKAVPLVLSLATTAANPTNQNSVGWLATFSESMTGPSTTNFSVVPTGISGASVQSVTGSASTRTITVNSGTGDGTLGLNLSSVTGIADTAGNALGAGITGGVYTVDKTAPVAPSTPDLAATSDSGTSSTDNYTNDTTPTFTGTAETGTTVTIFDGATPVGSVVASAGTYSITTSALTSTTHSISATSVDAASNVTPSGTLSVTIDAVAPTTSSVNLTGTSPTNASSVQYTVTFSESVSGLTTGNFTLTTTGSISGASVTSVTAGPSATYTVTVNAGTGSGTIRLNVNSATGVSDQAGNALSGTPFNTGQAYTIDKTAPTTSSITATSPTNAASVPFTVTFSESVSGVTTSNFSLTTTGVTGASITSVTAGPSATYTVAVNSGTGGGTIRVNLANGTGIADLAGNALGGTIPFTAGTNVTIDKTVPTVSDVTMADSNTNAVPDWIRQNTTFYVYAQVTDAGGMGTVSAAVNNTVSSAGTVSLSTTGGPFTVDGASYNYRSALVNARSSVTANSYTSTYTAVDAAGNSTGAQNFSATVDNTSPTATSAITMTNHGVLGTADATDTITLTYSEALSASAICSDWTASTNATQTETAVTATLNNSGGSSNSDFFTISGNCANIAGSSGIDTNANYTGNTRTFSNSTITWNLAAKTVTITLGTASGSVNTSVGSSTPTYSPSTGLRDYSGNQMSGTGVGAGSSSRL